MKCPHCNVSIHEAWSEPQTMLKDSYLTPWYSRLFKCPECDDWIVQFTQREDNLGRPPPADWTKWELIYPKGSSRGPVPPEVPEAIAGDYREACAVLPTSSKASAALSRRCLQNILRAHGYVSRDLWKEIDLLLNDSDPRKAIPDSLRMTVDGIRHFGNFSAHPVTDLTTFQIIGVEEHEAEWCLDILEELFQHYYVRPAQATARKAALDAKLAGAGKPPSK